MSAVSTALPGATELLAGFPINGVVTDPDILAAYQRDRELWAPSATPLALLRPRTTEQVAHAMRWASEHRIPVVPRGAGSGLTGAANALVGNVVMSMELMNTILEVDESDLCAVVQPGVVTSDLKRAAAQRNLFYAPDPSSADFCTVGGNVATNAGGLCCIKYGVTREAILGLEVVLADGRILRTGGRTVKNAAGFDLTSLFVGSEGQLGIVTEVTVRLLPTRTTSATLVATFADLTSAGQAVTAIVQSTRPRMCELMDSVTLHAVEAYRPSGLDMDAAALLLIQTDGTGSEAEIEHCQTLCDQAGATFVMTTSDPDEAEMLTVARRIALDALESQGQWILEDVCVPLSAVPRLISGCQQIGSTHGIQVASFGHAGDGNMHPTLVFPMDDDSARDRARDASEEIVRLAMNLGGTITGEHGVGIAKRVKMADQLGPLNLEVQRAIKTALDPQFILNPGKSLFSDIGGAGLATYH
jgi:glycolate oxidase